MAKPKDLKYEELLLHKRLEYFDKLQDALKDDESIASLSVDVLTSIVDGQCLLALPCIFPTTPFLLALKEEGKSLLDTNKLTNTPLYIIPLQMLSKK